MELTFGSRERARKLSTTLRMQHADEDRPQPALAVAEAQPLHEKMVRICEI
jgi:hypothetical protein